LRDRAVIAGDEREVASLYPGELCGEMACLSRTPRTATVRATAACYALELLRNVLELVQSNKKNPAFKERLEQVYRQRAIRSHILSLPLLQGVDAQVLDELARRVEYVVKQPGDVIFEEGKQSESVYLISIGQVRIVQSAPGGERFLGYNYRGDVLGEISATRGTPHSGTVIAYQHPRAGGRSKHASRVELLRLGKDDFLWLLKASPLVAQRIETIVAARTRPLGLETEDRTFGLAARFHELGLPQGQKLMVIDLERCTRCDECVRACAATHADSKTRLLREGPRFGHYLVPASCRQCRDPVCLIGCPVASIHKGPSGEIVIEDWCIGCKTCAEQCPYDAITMQDYEDPAATPAGDGEPHEHHAAAARSLAVVCDQCASLSDGVPSCVYSCPHDAALRRDVFELFPVRGPGTGRPRG
jgi:Fe-S-cluster-containing hydrogenase component 2/CRP-like cAMP-binding protein